MISFFSLNQSFLLILFLFNGLIFFNFNTFIKMINIYDFPDHSRKIHKKKTSLAGGVILYINILLFFFYGYFFQDLIYYQIKIFDFKQLFFLIFITATVFLIGLYDDKYNISFEKRLIFLFFIIFFYLNYNPQINITNIVIEQLFIDIQVNKISKLLITLIVISYIVSLNLFDGINLQSLCYFLVIVSIIILKNFFVLFNLSIFVPIIFLIYFNYKNKIFLGDSGIYLIGFLLSYNFIFGYQSDILTGETILMMVLMPIIDTIRVIITRVFKGLNPSKPRKDHIHHLLLNYFNQTWVFALIFMSYFIPLILMVVYEISLIICLCIFLVSYFLLINFKYVKKF